MSASVNPSFSPGRRWSLGFGLAIAITAVVAILVMANYLAARHSWRWSWSRHAQAELAPLSMSVLSSVTNQINVTIYFDKRDPLYELSWNLLKTYRFANPLINLETVDYLTEPGAAQVVKAAYQLGENDRDMVIFKSQLGQHRVVYKSELSDLDLQPLISGQSREVRRTHFKGEILFTSAIFGVINARQSIAYFLAGHGEHNPESNDGSEGYSRFAGVLRENNVEFKRLNLSDYSDVPADCSLLIIAGPGSHLGDDALDKVDRYLEKGGRLFVLFNYRTCRGRGRTGLEERLADWGVVVGQNNVILDEKNFDNQDKMNMVVTPMVMEKTHDLVRSVLGYQLYLILPRSIAKRTTVPGATDAPEVDHLLYTSENGRIVTDIDEKLVFRPRVEDRRGNVPLMVAVEKGGIPNVSADRGTTRLVVAGDSFFLSNNNIGREANRQFASHVVNWLLARKELLQDVPRRPITEYKLTLTGSQMKAARWVLMGGLPGSVLALGTLVWLRRRR
jgi:hypothetical protein